MNKLVFAFILSMFRVSSLATASEPRGIDVDSLLAKVSREAVLLSDLQRFVEVDKILICAGVIKREKSLPTERKLLLTAYIDEELMYLEARAKKISTEGQIPLSVQLILSKEACRSRWIALGERYAKLFRTETRTKEGEGLLVRELEKRVLIGNFRKKEVMPDLDLWKREAGVRYPVKVYLE